MDASSKKSAQLTFAGLRVTRGLSLGFGLMRQQLWLWPLLAAAMLAIAGLWIRNSVEMAAQMEMAEGLEATLRSNVEALKIWLENEKARVVEASLDPEVQRVASELVKLDRASGDDDALRESPLQDEFKAAIRPIVSGKRYEGYVLLSQDRKILTSDRLELVGQVRSTNYDLVTRALENGVLITPPIPSALVTIGADGVPKAGQPTMFALARQNDRTGNPVGVLGLRIPPSKDFVGILDVAKSGETGETYAFDKNGLLLSESRFTETLKELGLVPDQPDAKSQLNISIRDPGVDLTTGVRAKQKRSEQPLTLMATSALQAKAAREQAAQDSPDQPPADDKLPIDKNVMGYRDYRGVPVVGAWVWLDDYDFGVATEKDVAEAYHSLYIMRRAFWSLFGLLAASSVLILVFSLALSRLQRAAQNAALAANELGQYQLEHKLGEGGMGVVYRGRHRMLRRPTAIKLLHPDKTTDEAIARFEREVQLTCQLNHPNTIAIYDYGRTPEGIFYYAMEFLDGINLDTLVTRFGPQPAGRVIHILRQICGSLAEAHEISLVHRDIKPANILLTRRGGETDVAKVLDFGLVKAIDSKRDASLTSANAVLGTPLYISPEAVDSPDQVDARSDLYALAAVGYFLLTGKPPFDGASVIEICMHHARTPPRPPAEKLGQPLPADLSDALLKGLAKRPADRFQSARAFSEALAACADASSWTHRAADDWWRQHMHADIKDHSGDHTASIHQEQTLVSAGPLVKS